MTTQKQTQANRVNAKLGGVKTDEGKVKVRFNAMKHGVWGRLISEYEGDIYESLFDELIDELKPVGVIEQIIVERIAVAYLRLYRIAKAENEFMQETVNPKFISGDIMARAFSPTKEDGYDSLVPAHAVETMFMTYARYETTIENRIYRALQEFRSVRNGFVLQNGGAND